MRQSSVGTMALRTLAGGANAGEGPIEICMRQDDFQVIQVNRPEGGVMPAPANAKIQFTAQRFYELEESGIFEVTISVPTQGEPARARVFIDGADILYVKALSKVV